MCQCGLRNKCEVLLGWLLILHNSGVKLIRPQSVDSWDGGSTDELKKAAVEKKIGKNFEKF